MLQQIASFFEPALRSRVGRKSSNRKRRLVAAGTVPFRRSMHDDRIYRAPVSRLVILPKPREVAWRLYHEQGIRYR